MGGRATDLKQLNKLYKIYVRPLFLISGILTSPYYLLNKNLFTLFTKFYKGEKNGNEKISTLELVSK